MPQQQDIRAAFVRPGGGVDLRTVVKPDLEDGGVMIAMKSSGICGTDLEKLTGKGITSSILGHEVSGIVTESRAPNFQAGDRVIPHHHVSCNTCELCRAGAQTMCEKYKNSNFVPGGFADEFLIPAYNVRNGGLYKMGSNLTFDEASFAEPLACCIRGLSRAGVLGNHSNLGSQLRHVLVVGAGPIGLLHMELLRSAYPELEISAVDMISKRLDFAEENENARVVDVSKTESGSFFEASMKLAGPLGYDLVIVATGSEKAFTEAIRCVRKSGCVLLFGVPHRGAMHSLDLASLLLGELTITSSYATSESELRQAIDLLESKKINVSKFVTSKYPLHKIEVAMESARSENQVKILVTD